MTFLPDKGARLIDDEHEIADLRLVIDGEQARRFDRRIAESEGEASRRAACLDGQVRVGDRAADNSDGVSSAEESTRKGQSAKGIAPFHDDLLGPVQRNIRRDTDLRTLQERPPRGVLGERRRLDKVDKLIGAVDLFCRKVCDLLRNAEVVSAAVIVVVILLADIAYLVVVLTVKARTDRGVRFGRLVKDECRTRRVQIGVVARDRPDDRLSRAILGHDPRRRRRVPHLGYIGGESHTVLREEDYDVIQLESCGSDAVGALMQIDRAVLDPAAIF